MSDSIRVYVRKGADNNQRLISFDRPARISAAELLKRGIALDGNQAVVSVVGVFDHGDGWSFSGALTPQMHTSLADALLAEERELVSFLESEGYEADFQ